MGNHRTAIDNVVSGLADSIVRHTITLVVLLPMMELAYEENSHVTLFRHDDGMLDCVRSARIPESAANSKYALFVDEWI